MDLVIFLQLCCRNACIYKIYNLDYHAIFVSILFFSCTLHRWASAQSGQAFKETLIIFANALTSDHYKVQYACMHARVNLCCGYHIMMSYVSRVVMVWATFTYFPVETVQVLMTVVPLMDM